MTPAGALLLLSALGCGAVGCGMGWSEVGYGASVRLTGVWGVGGIGGRFQGTPLVICLMLSKRLISLGVHHLPHHTDTLPAAYPSVTHHTQNTNYPALRTLYETYKADGFNLVAFPCNQFGGQAPGSSEEERAWAFRKFGFEFDVFVSVVFWFFCGSSRAAVVAAVAAAVC